MGGRAKTQGTVAMHKNLGMTIPIHVSSLNTTTDTCHLLHHANYFQITGAYFPSNSFVKRHENISPVHAHLACNNTPPT